MGEAEGWYICRPGFVDVVRAVGLTAGERATKAVKDEWPAFAVIEIDQLLAEHAASLALARGLRSLDAIHLAAALLVAGEDLTLATWDRRLHDAARAEGLDVLPATLD
jgi:hypothetical protein